MTSPSPQVTALEDGCRLTLFPEWLASGPADALMAQALETLDWQQETVRLFGREHRQPRLTAWVGHGLSAHSRYREPTTAAPWVGQLAEVRAAIEALTGVAFNAALANYYRDGQDAVGWHADDEAVLGADPVIASW